MSAVKILAADDNEVNRLVLSAYLERFDVDLTLVETGATAVAAFREGSFDLILLDRHMPEMDGIDACREMRRIEAETGRDRRRIYGLSADIAPEQVAKVMEAGADGYLAKPIDFQELSRVIWPGA
ncbi:MAG: response regulator [Pseudomonadota bacterium]